MLLRLCQNDGVSTFLLTFCPQKAPSRQTVKKNRIISNESRLSWVDKCSVLQAPLINKDAVKYNDIS